MGEEPGDPTRADTTVRSVERSDVPGIVRLERAVYPDPWRRRAFDELLDLSAGLGVVAVDPDGGDIVGYALGWVAGDEVELANLAVAPRHRRRGIGTRLLERFLGAARRRGARRTVLEVRVGNTAARAFYARAGFEPVGCRPGYYARPREDALVLAAPVPDAGG